MGLGDYGTPLSSSVIGASLVAILADYVIQRPIEGAFIASFGMHIHVWRPLDSQFRLVTVRRNPNMIILFVAMYAMRPDLDLLALAWWTVLSCLFHAVRLGQAYSYKARGAPILSWLAGA